MHLSPRPPRLSLDDLEAVARVSFADPDLPAAAHYVLDLIISRLPCSAAALSLVDRRGELRHVATLSRDNASPAHTIDVGSSSVAARAVREIRPITHIVSSGPNEPGARPAAPFLVAMPIALAGEAIGVLVVQHASRMTRPQLRALRHFAHHVALGLRLARAEDRADHPAGLEDLIPRARHEHDDGNYLDRLFDTLGAALIVVDAGTLRVDYANHDFHALLGQHSGVRDVAGTRLDLLLPPNLRDVLLDLVREALEASRTAKVTERLLTDPADKHAYWDITVVPFRLQRDRVKLVVSLVDVTSEVTARRRVQELAALADGERRRLHALLENLPVGVLIVDAGGAISMVNHDAERLLGITAADAQLRQIADHTAQLFTPDGQPLPVGAWPVTRALKDGEVLRGVELAARSADGNLVSLLVNASPILDCDETICGAVAVFQDLTTLKQISRMEERDQLKAEFIAGVSHELRTPLHYIKGYTAALLRRDLRVTPEEIRDFLEIIERESDKLGQMIEDLLDTSRIEAGVMAVDLQRVDLASILRRAVENARRTAPAHDILLVLPEDVPVVRADPRRLDQVVANLLDNAIKYSAPGTRITLSARVTPETVVVLVADQGDGIATEHLPHIFDRFFRVPHEHRRYVRGSGLGLFICRGLIEAQGGNIWAESAPGEGTRVGFSVPRHS